MDVDVGFPPPNPGFCFPILVMGVVVLPFSSRGCCNSGEVQDYHGNKGLDNKLKRKSTLHITHML